MSWSDKYIGIPQEDCHCYELLRRVYRTEIGIELPNYDESVVRREERAAVAAIINDEEASQSWVRVEGTSGPKAFDAVMFNQGRMRSHVGIFVAGGKMLHMQDQAVIETFGYGLWQPRLEGIYRHIKSPFIGHLIGGLKA